MGDGRMVARLGDDGPAVGVPQQDDRRVERVEDVPHPLRVPVQVGQRSGVAAVAGKVGRHDVHAGIAQRADHALPAPRAVPCPMHEDDGSEVRSTSCLGHRGAPFSRVP